MNVMKKTQALQLGSCSSLSEQPLCTADSYSKSQTCLSRPNPWKCRAVHLHTDIRGQGGLRIPDISTHTWAHLRYPTANGERKLNTRIVASSLRCIRTKHSVCGSISIDHQNTCFCTAMHSDNKTNKGACSHTLAPITRHASSPCHPGNDW